MSDLWAITAYFNPLGYRNRLANFRVFRDRLGIPLVAAELVFGGQAQLGADDAEILVLADRGDVLWQKERLLNVARRALPPSCRFVAWVDCDVVFADGDWADRARDALRRHALVQPHTVVRDLAPGVRSGDLESGPVVFERETMASVHARGAIDDAETGSSMLGAYSPGHAWCARRDSLDHAGFYEHMILGSGDFAMASAALGRQGRIPGPYRMNAGQAAHYLAWAGRYREAMEAGMGVVDGTLLHLWHGDLDDRRYDTRYDGLAPHDFDPEGDVAATDGCGLTWSSDKPALHAYVRDYFAARREDGRQADQTR